MKRMIIFLSLLATTYFCRAQVSYHDIVPDSTINTWNACVFQIDSPFTADVSHESATITIWDDFGSEIDVNANLNCEVQMSGGMYPLALNAGDVIDSSGTWLAPNYSILYDGTNGNWQNKTDKYLPVRIHEGTKKYYGWIRLDVNSAGNSVTIKDYACNMSSGRSIKAGQKDNTGLQNIEHGNIQLAVINKTISFIGLDKDESFSVNVLDMSGRLLIHLPVLTSNALDMSIYPPGLYIVSLQSSATHTSFKISIGG